ncbi:hypothetical protein DVK02_10745 [Halobellus sp. Atlit-31R]|nr:hypothetical protein DVK02_10745 [Halobellus sp. Atlit-31R]
MSGANRRARSVGVVAVVVAASVLAVGVDAAAGSELAALVVQTQRNLELLERVGAATGRLNVLRGIGALAGLAVGVVLGAAVAYGRRRR